MNKKSQIIGLFVLLFVGAFIFYFLMQDNAPFNGGDGSWTPLCGNGKCEAGSGIDEFLTCPSDCGIICGDGECVIDPYDERIYCSQDCYADPCIDKYCGDGNCDNSCGESQQNCALDCNIPPSFTLVGGMGIQHERSSGSAYCTLGMVVKKNNYKYILTAGHCVTKGSDGMPDYPEDIGLWAKYEGTIIGYVYDFDNSGGIDAALISIEQGIQSQSYTDLNGNFISGFTNPVEGMDVFKIGKSTGITYGTITDTNIFYEDKQKNLVRGFEVTGNNGQFSTSGDSGSAIVTVNAPHKIVGIISAGSGSNWGLDIKDVLDID